MLLAPPEIKSKETWEISSNPYPLEVSYPLKKEEVKHIQIRIVNLSSNISLLEEYYYKLPPSVKEEEKENYNRLQSNIFYLDLEKINNKSIIQISDSSQKGDIFIKNSWTPENIYKIQIRYGKTKLWDPSSTPSENFIEWYSRNKEDFSEWSTPLLLKVIDKPIISCNVSSALTPRAQGKCVFNNSSEKIEFIKFDLLNNTKNSIIESSNWMPYLNNPSCLYSFKTKSSMDAYIKFSIKTFSGYSTSIIPDTKLSKIIFPDPDQNFKVKANYEEGGIEVTIPSDFVGGSLWRGSSKDKYLTLEKIFEITEQSQKKKIDIFNDNTVEDGVSYQYYLYSTNSQIKTSPIITAYLDNNYLEDKNLSLKLEFNEKLSSFKHNIFMSKMDTLGSKYPVIIKNGPSYYASFSISGLILKEEEKIPPLQNVTYERVGKSKGVIKLVEEPNLITYNSQNFSREKIFNERKYRQEIEQFLTNGEYKIYRSSTEGNFIIVLTDVSLTPVEGLDRALYEFSATAYEVDEYSLENLRKNNLLKTEVI